ncbi:metal ABC transporter permease [Pseudotabrizicola algicola]|uniref:Metal ABC transporter permease n=1 Tax=Pseudotabrizicola algicola TaxID=2709381 RepID=A0A6B3RRC7_9RHOB|nr:metal ABC transporter permease [Pseudotabrizicola algicola]NEX47358.1 metal ABC transporter permease [Pseudotabrizicola algicola]
MIWQALLLQAGYNAALVSLGAACLGAAAGAAGAFLTLRRRALMSDAMAHATLPGIGLGFLVMVALGGDGRFLPGLMLGAALTAALGLWAVQRLSRQIHEDAATGAVLASFYGAGIVLLTLIQGLGTGRPAGLETVLLGSTAGMLRADALVIGFGGLAVVAALWVLRRPLTLVAFDPLHAAMMGINPRRMDSLLMALVLAVVLVGLNVTGLILIVALLVTPAVTARMWSGTVSGTASLSALIGAVCGYLGAAISAGVPDLPTGPVIVLLAAAAFMLTLLVRGRRDG